MGSPGRFSPKTSADIFGKQGITFDEHHMLTKDGKFSASPPKELTKLYQQGPPKRLAIQADINSLKLQSHCCGVYSLLEKQQINNKPTWKHCTEDLAICFGQLAGDAGEGWQIVRWTTSQQAKQQVCMRIAMTDKDAMPFKAKASQCWQAWNGRDWAPAPSAKCRISYHGWGVEKLDSNRPKHAPHAPDGAY